MEKFMDEMDKAYDYELAERKAALSRILNRRKGQGPLWKSGVPHCKRCDAVIPAKRVDFLPDAETCVDCQEEMEMAY
jgi:phage/conjugal plasmid C-4 type zinc finger TraR family protein